MDTFTLWKNGPAMEIFDAQPIGTDSVLLADFARVAGITKAADFGAGSGFLAIVLALRNRKLAVDLVEMSGKASICAERNIKLNGLGDRLRVLNRDLRTLTEAEVGKYQLIISNPPYYPEGSGTSASSPQRQTSREERDCTLRELSRSASRLLGDGGRFDVVLPAQRIAEAFCAFTGDGLEPKRLRLVQERVDAAPSVALLECGKRRKAGLRVEPVLILKNPDGSETDEFRRIYHREEC